MTGAFFRRSAGSLAERGRWPGAWPVPRAEFPLTPASLGILAAQEMSVNVYTGQRRSCARV